MMLGAVDTVMLSQYSDNSVAAVGVVNQLIMFAFLIFEVINIGTSVLCSQYLGARMHKNMVQVVGVSLILNLVFGLFVSAILHYGATSLLSMMGLRPELMEYGVSYMKIVGVFAFFQAISLTISASLRSANKAVYPMMVTVVVNILNIIGNYSLIFGKFGFPAMGIAGAAIGSSLAELVSVLFFIVYTYKRIDFRKYGLNHIPRFRTRELSQIMHISIWTMIQNFISLSTWFLFFIFIEHLGERPLAISNIIRSVSSIPFMTVTAFASTCSSLVSNQIGAGHSRQVPALINQHIRLCACIVVPLVALISLFPSPVLRIYTDIPDLIAASIPTLWVLCSTYLVSIPGFIYFQSVSGTGNTRAAFILEMIALVLYIVYILIVIIGLKADVAVCWTAEHLYAICIGVASYLYIKKFNWQHKRI